MRGGQLSPVWCAAAVLLASPVPPPGAWCWCEHRCDCQFLCQLLPRVVVRVCCVEGTEVREDTRVFARAVAGRQHGGAVREWCLIM